MKTSRLWTHVQHYLLLLGVVCAGLSVASSAGAQQNEYPSSQASGPFSKWRKMNPSMFDVGSITLLEQCQTAEPTKDWLGTVHCKRLIEAKEEGRYEVVWIDGKKLDILLGRVDSDPDKNARVHHYQEMQLGRLARALFFDLGDGVYSYWFTGEQGKSCNNLAFVFIPPKPVTAKVSSQSVPYAPPAVMRHTGVVGSTSVQFNQGFTLNNCCSSCPAAFNVQGNFVVVEDGDGLQSYGASVVDR